MKKFSLFITIADSETTQQATSKIPADSEIDTTQQVTSKIPVTRVKNPKRVAAGKYIAENTWRVRE